MSVLIVEDNEISLRIIDLNLRKHQFETILTKDGEKAWEKLQSNPDIQLVITDLMLPRLTGLELISRMTENQKLKEIPVIVCTSVDETRVVQKAITNGCRDYIVKPINAGRLVAKVRHLLAPPLDGELSPENN